MIISPRTRSTGGELPPAKSRPCANSALTRSCKNPWVAVTSQLALVVNYIFDIVTSKTRGSTSSKVRLCSSHRKLFKCYSCRCKIQVFVIGPIVPSLETPSSAISGFRSFILNELKSPLVLFLLQKNSRATTVEQPPRTLSTPIAIPVNIWISDWAIAGAGSEVVATWQTNKSHIMSRRCLRYVFAKAF